MITPSNSANRRILIVDDNPAIHEDFRKILSPQPESISEFHQSKAFLFDETPALETSPGFEIDSAYQGQEGLEKVRLSAELRQDYALAFVDLRMPPGWDGIETISQMWRVSPQLEVVICTAYSDYTWEEISRALGHSENLLILMKPYDRLEVLQLADALTKRWEAGRRVQERLTGLVEINQRLSRQLREANQRLGQANLSLERKIEGEAGLAQAADHEFGPQLPFLESFHDDLQPLLSGILRMAGLLLDSNLTPEQYADAKSILSRSQNLLRLVGALSSAQPKN